MARSDSNYVDSSGWDRPVSGKDGEVHPAPAQMEREQTGAVKFDEGTGLPKRAVTPDPYKNGGNGHTNRNFGRS